MVKHNLRAQISPRLNEQGKGKVKPHLARESGLKGLGLSHKGIAPLLVIFGLIIFILGGYVVYGIGKSKGEVSGFPSPPPDTSRSVIVETSPSPVSPIPSNQVNPGLSPQLPINTPCIPSGYLKSAYAYHKKKIGDSSSVNRGAPISYQFVVTNSCEANIYAEAGLLQTGGLTILSTTPSACDGNPHFSGRWLKGSKDTQFVNGLPAGTIDIAFFPQDYNREENLRIVAGIYSNCLDRGGQTISEIPPQSLSIKNSYSDTEITNSVTRII